MSEQITLELKFNVTYDTNGVSVDELKDNLERLVRIGIGDGLLTWNSPAEVDSHSYSVVEVADSHWDNDPDFPVEDWQSEVSNDDTRLGYREWVAHQKEEADDE